MNSYTISFDLNGGSGLDFSRKEIIFGQNYVLPNAIKDSTKSGKTTTITGLPDGLQHVTIQGFKSLLKRS